MLFHCIFDVPVPTDMESDYLACLKGLYILPMFLFYFVTFFNGRFSNTCFSESNGLIFTKILVNKDELIYLVKKTDIL